MAEDCIDLLVRAASGGRRVAVVVLVGRHRQRLLREVGTCRAGEQGS